MESERKSKIVVGRPDDWIGWSLRSFVVRIDGRRAGKVKPGLEGDFSVEPGTHAVCVSMDWFQSQPFHVDLQPGWAKELIFRNRSDRTTFWTNILPLVICGMIAFQLRDMLLELDAIANAGWWLRRGLFLGSWFFASTFAIFMLGIISTNNWMSMTLEPVDKD